MKALLAGAELFFGARIRETARLAGATLVEAGADAAEVARRERPELVLLDLDATALDPAATARAIRTVLPAVRIVGFVRHGEAERIAAAREARIEVLARGAFTARLPALLGAG